MCFSITNGRYPQYQYGRVTQPPSRSKKEKQIFGGYPLEIILYLLSGTLRGGGEMAYYIISSPRSVSIFSKFSSFSANIFCNHPSKQGKENSERLVKKVEYILIPRPPKILKNLSEISNNYLMDLPENSEKFGQNIAQLLNATHTHPQGNF